MDTRPDALQSDTAYDAVKEYYGEVLQNTSDLKTDACCTSETFAPRVTNVLSL